MIAMSHAPLDRVVVVLGAHAGEVRKRVPFHGATPTEAGNFPFAPSGSRRPGRGSLVALNPSTVPALVA